MWTPDRIRSLRKVYGETQEQFAIHFRVKVFTVRCWEQGQGEPSGPAQVILDQLEAAVEKEPAA